MGVRGRCSQDQPPAGVEGQERPPAEQQLKGEAGGTGTGDGGLRKGALVTTAAGALRWSSGVSAQPQDDRARDAKGEAVMFSQLHTCERWLAGGHRLLRSGGFAAKRVKVARMENGQVTAGETAEQREERTAGSKS